MGLENARPCRPSYRRGGSSRASPRSGVGSRRLRQQAEKKGMRKESWEARESPRKSVWKGRYEMVADDHGACVVQIPRMENWATFQGERRPRMVVAGLRIETEGPVEVVTAHARLAQDLEPTVGAGAPGQVFRERFDDCVVTVHPGMQDRDVEPFKDFPGGDDTVDEKESTGTMLGAKTTKYRAGTRRGPYRLEDCLGPKYIRVHAKAANMRRKSNGTCAIVFSFKLGPGAKVTICRVTFDIYF